MTAPSDTNGQGTSVDLLASQLVHNDFTGFSDLFHLDGSPAPILIWSPDTRILEHSAVDRFARICDEIVGPQAPGGAMKFEDFDLERFGAVQDWVMLLRRESPTDFRLRYAHYGQGIARVYGRDLTGRDVSGFPGHITTFFRAVYLAVAERRERLLSIHQPPRQVFVSTWRRLIVPLTSGETCTGFAVLNQPTNELRDGLEILPAPVLIADHAKIVRYANKEARQTFDSGNYGPWDRNLFDYAGLDLDIVESPEQILRYGMARKREVRAVQHQQIGRFDAAISAARHHATAFYVILLTNEAGSTPT